MQLCVSGPTANTVAVAVAVITVAMAMAVAVVAMAVAVVAMAVAVAVVHMHRAGRPRNILSVAPVLIRAAVSVPAHVSMSTPAPHKTK